MDKLKLNETWAKFSILDRGVLLHHAGVNFTNILRAAFSYESFCASFMCLQFGFVIFWRKDFGTKAAHEMLVKLTPERLSNFEVDDLAKTTFRIIFAVLKI